MIGSVAGDIVGSRYEFWPTKSTTFTLFTRDCRPTDDSVMSLAVCRALLDYRAGRGELPALTVQHMQDLGHRYPHAGYGGRFLKWLHTEQPEPYNSFGNGSAMRIGGVAWVARDLEEVKTLSAAVSAVTHNHPEGLKGAEATAVAAFLARQGQSKEAIRAYITEHYYPLEFRLKDIRPTYGFSEICQTSVPEALACFFEGDSYERTVRLAVSLGGDADTQAAIAGGIAECFYGVPKSIRQAAEGFLTPDLLAILREFEATFA